MVINYLFAFGSIAVNGMPAVAAYFKVGEGVYKLLAVAAVGAGSPVY